MNPFLFLGFDISTGMRTLAQDPSTPAENSWYSEFLFPSGVFPTANKLVAQLGLNPHQQKYPNLTLSQGRHADSYALGGSGRIASPSNFFHLTQLGSPSEFGGPGLYFNRSGFGVTDRVYYSCDFFMSSGGGTAANNSSIFAPAPYNGTYTYINGLSVFETGNSILNFGKAAIRYMGYSGFNGTTANITFGIYNNDRFITRLDVTGKNVHEFSYIKAHIFLNTGSGSIDLYVDNFSVSHTGNTLSGLNTLDHKDVQEVVFAPSAISNIFNYAQSKIDNCYFSKEGFANGRPNGKRLYLNTSRNNVGWQNFNSDSLASGVSPSGTGYISGLLNSSAEFVTSIPSYNTGDVLVGFQFGVLGANNNDFISGRKLAASPVIQGIQYNPVISGEPISNSLFRSNYAGQILNINQGITGLNDVAMKLTVI